MKTIGIKTVSIALLSNPDEFMGRVDLPRIVERAGSIKDLGMLHEPIVRESDMRLLVGRDRVAALVKLEKKDAKVKLVECTDREAKLMEDTENLARRHDPQEQAEAMARMLALYTEQEAAKPGKRDRAGRPLGSKTAKGKARDRLAAEVGVKPEAIRRREYRAKEKERGATIKQSDAGLPPIPTDATILLLGMDQPMAFLAQCKAIQEYLTEASGKVRGSQMILNQLRSAELPKPAALVNRLYEDTHALAVELKASKPFALCGYCKNLAGVVDECNGCSCCGWVTEAQHKATSKQFLAEGDGACVQYRGETRLVSELVNTQADEAVAEAAAVSVDEDMFS